MTVKALMYFFLILQVCLLAACSDNDTKIILDKSSVIVAFGDSLTKGKGVDIKNGYPSQLQSILGIDVLNKGISGEVSKIGLVRLEGVLQSNAPDLVILCHGGNDILRKLPLDELEQNLAKMIVLIESYGAKVMLVGVPKPAINLKALSLYDDLAKEYELVSDLDILSDLLEETAMKSDRVHLNDKGYKAFALALSQKIEMI